MIGKQFDSLRSRLTSSRWEVTSVNEGKAWLIEVGQRIGPPPRAYVMNRRKLVPGKFAGWPLGPVEGTPDAREVHLETLRNQSDYAPVEESGQATFFGDDPCPTTSKPSTRSAKPSPRKTSRRT